ncbi:glomulin, FKBP associated protein b isoform X1 [Danio rerio]|uniref:Glomulin, FKBP associated protein b isoform X1 n=1 Tax=Danio rerio TaxID=7955 RepID=A0A8M3BAD7_DANRE|nr:glomulin, FKBP associated protein b isoform X1 [Danio rerio]|eukprot:XP_009300664.1 glomulin, FKBP associated protein b isoform X1 [Danio rerio]
MAVNQLEDVIQKWRTIEEFKPEDHELFLNAGHTCIAQGDGTLLLNFIKDEANKHIVRSMGGGLVPALVSEVLRNGRSAVHCQAILSELVQICRVKEVLNTLLQQVDDADPNAIADSIIVLMPPIQSVLLRMSELKAPGLSMALDSLQKQISKLPVPYSNKQEQEDVYGLCRCCTAVLTFIQPFVQEVKNQDTNSEATSLRAALLKLYVFTNVCMNSLREPLLQAQLDREGNKTEILPLWNFAAEIMAILVVIQESLPKILFYHPVRGKEDDILEKQACHPNESKACIAYLLFVQLIAIDVFPAVFSPVFVLQCNMEYINLLLSRKDESWILKGLDLHVKSLERITACSLPVELLDLKPFHEVPQSLIKIMIECPIQHLRGRSLVVFQLFIEKLNGEAKHKFFRRIIKTSHHAGVESTILKNIKNQVEQTRKSVYQDGWFEGTRLISLLRDTICLPQGHETDLLHGMDRVMESLNLLRYLLIQKRGISTGEWTDLCHIAETYTKLLRVCLSMSKSYYGTELKRLRENKKIKAKEFKEASGKRSVQSLIVKTETLGSMPPEAQDKVLQCALVTCDLMESLVVRIEEIIEESQK